MNVSFTRLMRGREPCIFMELCTAVVYSEHADSDSTACVIVPYVEGPAGPSSGNVVTGQSSYY